MVIRWESTEKGIKLTDNNGKDLMRVLPKEIKSKILEQKKQQYKQSYDDIRYKIVSHDVISFDIFDTLITRRVLEPETVFDLVGRYAIQNGIQITDFRKERIKAQLESGLNNANLDEIYDQLIKNTHITKEQAEQLKREELKCEKRIVIPRREVVDLFYFALEAQKTVYLTTDMYLNRQYIVSLLNTCGITGYYDILDSCEYRKLKLEGLFDELKALNPLKTTLHIGDSYINDCICAEVAGVDSILIPKSIDMAKNDRMILPDQFSSMSDKNMIGSIISHVYNNPFIQNPQDRNKHMWFETGYSCLGPIVLSLVEWIINKIEQNSYDGILLSARDGYLLYKAFSILKERKIFAGNINVHYFYTSRKATVAMHTDEEATINMLIDRTAPFYLPDRLMQEVFCVEKKHIKPYDLDLYGDERYKYVWEQYKVIKDNVYRLKRNFYRYLGKEGFNIGGKYLLYDFVSSGTVQRSLIPIVPFELDGIYFQFTGKKDFKGNIYSKFSKKNNILSDNYKLIESLMLSPEPSLWGYDENGDVVYCSEQRTDEHLNHLESLHEGVLSFINEFMDSFEPDDAMISDELILYLIQKMGKQYNRKEELIDDWLVGGLS